MSITITTDVFCDQCNRWAHYHAGTKAVPAEAVKAARADGWKIDRRLKATCPACLGDRPHYFSSISASPPTIPPLPARHAQSMRELGMEGASIVPVTELLDKAKRGG